MRALDLDSVWLMVSPGNPLKDGMNDMAPLAQRLASARRITRRSPIRATAIEATLGTRYTVDTLAGIVRRYPKWRFVWLMGADNLAQFHRWKDWRRIAATVTIAAIARPGYHEAAHAGQAWPWLRRFVRPAHQAKQWTKWRPPALVLLRLNLDPASSTSLRRADPGWHQFSTPKGQRDPVTRRPVA